MIIFRKIHSDFDFFQVSLKTPSLKYKKAQFEVFDDDYLTGLDAPTRLLYTEDRKSFWNFEISFLGFGFTIYRQYSY